MFDPTEYNIRISRLHVELTYLYRIILNEEKNIIKLANKMDMAIDSALLSYNSVMIQNRLLNKYLKYTKQYIEIFDYIKFIKPNNLLYSPDSINYPNMSVDLVDSYVILNESSEYDVSSVNIFDYYNLTVYSDSETSDVNVQATLTFNGQVNISAITLDLISYNDLTIMNIESRSNLGSSFSDVTTDYEIINSGFTNTIIFAESQNAIEIRLTIENHHPVSSVNRDLFVDSEIKTKLTGLGDVETLITNFVAKGKLDQAIYLTEKAIQSSAPLDISGWIYHFMVGNIKTEYYGNMDINRFIVNSPITDNVIGHSILYDIDSASDYNVITNMLMNNKRYPIPSYNTLAFDSSDGLYYDVVLYVETDSDLNITVNLVPQPLDGATIKIYNAIDLTSNPDTPALLTIDDEDLLAVYTDYTVNTFKYDMSDIATYSGEVFLIKYQSRGR
jgi:hypothetical protein